MAAEPGLTRRLAAAAAALRFEDLPDEIVSVAKQCVLDGLAVTIAGAGEDLSRMVRDEALAEGGNEQATIAGDGAKTSAARAAHVNGTAAHALDYDDVNQAASGHPTVPILPAVLALGEWRGLTGKAFLRAFVAGYETTCRIGPFVAPRHYGRGYHGTATIGCFGAAAGAANLLGLSAERAAHAFGIAGTQAAGLKSMFGTMCKPLHAGNAAETGLRAALLAARGFTSNPDVLETEQGFGAVLSDSADAGRDLEPGNASGFHIRNNLFKYHAACYRTHSMLEAVRALQAERAFPAEAVTAARVYVNPEAFSICNLQEPRTGLEAKFSLRLGCAFAIAGLDTAQLATYSDANANDPGLIALRDKIAVLGEVQDTRDFARIEIELDGGERLAGGFDVAIPAADLSAQQAALEAKCASLVAPVLGEARCRDLIAACRGLESLDTVATLAALSAPETGARVAAE